MLEYGYIKHGLFKQFHLTLGGKRVLRSTNYYYIIRLLQQVLLVVIQVKLVLDFILL